MLPKPDFPLLEIRHRTFHTPPEHRGVMRFVMRKLVHDHIVRDAGWQQDDPQLEIGIAQRATVGTCRSGMSRSAAKLHRPSGGRERPAPDTGPDEEQTLM